MLPSDGKYFKVAKFNILTYEFGDNLQTEMFNHLFISKHYKGVLKCSEYSLCFILTLFRTASLNKSISVTCLKTPSLKEIFLTMCLSID